MLQKTIVIFILVVAAFSLASSAQETTGTILGVVSDPQGAVVAGATIVVTNTGQNVVTRTVQSDSSGKFVAPLLPVGSYSVSITAPGFQTFNKTNIALNVNERLTLNAQLSIGSSQQEVNVQANALQVDTQSAAAQGLIVGVQIRELALKSRNYEELVALMPGVTKDTGDTLFAGVSAPEGGTNEVAFSLNGSLGYQNNWTIDGADNVDRGGNFTLLNYPSVDAIAEFNVLRGNYSAEYGRAGGGQINVITNSGNSKFHGGAYEFFRNDVLDANTWLNNHAVPKIPRTPLRYNDFGWTLGGPVFIPGHYNKERNKTFFFYSQEFRRITESTSNTATVANLQERGLDPAFGNKFTFASPICPTNNFDGAGNCLDPTTTQLGPGTPYPISPLAAAYLKDVFSKVPLPQNPNTDSLISSGRNVFNYRQEIIRVDHIVGPRLSFFARYMNDYIPTVETGGLFNGNAIPKITETSTNSPGRNIVATAVMAFSPTFLNELRYAYSFGGVVSANTGVLPYAKSPDVAAAVNLPFPNILKRIPNINFSAGTGFSGFGDYRDFNRNFNLADNVTKVVGSHTLKFGATFHWYQKSENSAGNNVGTFSFSSPAGTFQQEWANFLLGNVASFTQLSTDFRAETRQKELEMYGQDEFRVRRNITLSYGLRYSLFRQPTDARARATSFDPFTFNIAKAPTLGADGNLCLPSACVVGATPIAPNPNYDPLNGMIIGGKNSPFGAAVARQNNLKFAPRIGIAWDPFDNGKTSIRAGYGIFVESPGIGFVENNLFQNPPFVQNITINGTTLDNPGSTAPANNIPLGVAGTDPKWHQPYTQQWDLDLQHEFPYGFLADIGYYGSKGTHLMGLRDINQPVPGAYASNPVFGGTQVNSNTATFLNFIRPYQGYASINMYQTNFYSNYNSLQASLQKRFSGNSLAAINYTWSKNLTNLRVDPIFTVPQNSYDPVAEYGPSRFDRRHVFNANFVYELPWLKDQQGFAGHVLGGWEISGILSIVSGAHLTPTTASSFDPGGAGLQGNGRPDQVANPNSHAPHNAAMWFNTAAFVDVPATQFRPGNAPTASIIGPGEQRWDLSMFKNFALRESWRLQFRAESFNLFNHTNYSSINTQLGSPDFGKVVGAHAPRIIQVALKLSF